MQAGQAPDEIAGGQPGFFGPIPWSNVLPARSVEHAEHGEQRDQPQHLYGEPHEDLPRPVVLPRPAPDLRLDLAVPLTKDTFRLGFHRVRVCYEQ
jgi:hypothetical protein